MYLEQFRARVCVIYAVPGERSRFKDYKISPDGQEEAAPSVFSLLEIPQELFSNWSDG